MILLIDLDGVAAQWYKAILEELQERFPDDRIPTVDEIRDYSVLPNFDEKYHPHLEDIMSSEGLYLRLEPYQAALDAMRDIEVNCRDFITPFICTKPPHVFHNHMAHSEKVQWVHKHLGKYWSDRVILAPDKTMIWGDFLVDDHPDIKGVNPKPSWVHLVNSQSYNVDAETDLHVYGNNGRMAFNWKDWADWKKFFTGYSA